VHGVSDGDYLFVQLGFYCLEMFYYSFDFYYEYSMYATTSFY
jgi:hypothetical protein